MLDALGIQPVLLSTLVLCTTLEPGKQFEPTLIVKTVVTVFM
jgi:hypothetical protein